MENKIILAIETSCDETSISLHKGSQVIDIETFTQIKEHNNYGGVIPEFAGRMHSQEIAKVYKTLMNRNEMKAAQIDYVAFTKQPGIINSLQVGLIAAKTIAMLTNKPLISIDHLQGHLLSPFINEKNIEKHFPMIGLIISGGHTDLYIMKDSVSYQLIGKTTDDAMGEVYDKVGKKLGLSYPSGPEIDKLTTSKEGSLKFNKPKTKELDFSFSGIKSQYFREIEKTNVLNIEDIINSFQYSISNHMMDKLTLASEKYNIFNLSISGGVSRSPYLREKITSNKMFKNIYFAKPKYCSDNAAMIGYAAYQNILNKVQVNENLDVDSSPKSTLH